MLSCEEIMEVNILRKQGLSFRKLAKKLCKAVNTIRKYCNGGSLGYKRRSSVGSKFDPYKDYMKQRIAAVQPKWIPASVMFREIQVFGYIGKVRILQDYMRTVKTMNLV